MTQAKYFQKSHSGVEQDRKKGISDKPVLNDGLNEGSNQPSKPTPTIKGVLKCKYHKMPIKKKYFDMIKSGNKTRVFREAHITFVCEETGKELRKEVIGAGMFSKKYLHKSIKPLFKEKDLIVFDLK